ncbi:cyclic nucleotide-binding-like protein [Obelidium mucronatum]|nr:cyclic nucleotide-binding-like protein [Obelidium mucronatum]
MDEAINSEPQLSKLVENFAAHKDDWWKDQKYLDSQESFGAEFAHDIARKDLRKVPMFASAPESFIQSLAMKTQCFVAEPNQSIVSIGEESDAIYFVLTGTLQVVGSTGAIHAEMTDVGVILNLNRTASVRAKVKSHIFKLSKSDLLGVISGYPVMEVALNNAASERYALMNERDRGGSSGSSAPKVAGAENDGMTQQTQHFPDQFDIEIGTQSLAKLSIFNGVDSSVVTQLSMKMTRKTWPVSEMIIKCGDIGDGMYFLAAGNAEVITEFGEVIDSHVPRTASVKCTSVCSTYELRKRDFLAVMERYTDETADARMQKYLMRNVLA